MNSKLLEQIKRLAELAHKEHFHCDEDSYYSCPQSPHSYKEKWEPCECDADKHNAEVDALIKEIMTGQEET
jgi:hypothetical protein